MHNVMPNIRRHDDNVSRIKNISIAGPPTWQDAHACCVCPFTAAQTEGHHVLDSNGSTSPDGVMWNLRLLCPFASRCLKGKPLLLQVSGCPRAWLAVRATEELYITGIFKREHDSCDDDNKYIS